MRVPGYMTVRECALLMQTSELKIYEMIKTGQLEAINTGTSKQNRWQIPEDAPGKVLDARRQAPRQIRRVLEYF